MGNSEAGTSNDAVPASGSEYQVFLSFRGLDTRHGFTDFLYHNLLDVGVHVFRDDDELRVGEVIGENLLSAINNSIIYIPVFSRTYASSKWCLRELAHIVDNMSKSEDEKCILPIFLDVEPDDVKLKTPIYSNALLEHERKFPDKVEAWRAALVAVGKIKGWHVTSSQAAIVKLVVKEVLEKLKIKQKSVTKHLVGLDGRIKELTKLLDVNHNDVRLIGIYGMGGIGKTTIAMVIFNQLYSHFGKCCSFLEGIRERSTKEGIVPLQKKLLSDIGGSTAVGEINDSEEGMRRIGATLNSKKVLVVLDDVDKKVSIKNLIGNSKLCRGSRIIITTRDISVLEVEGFKDGTRKYEMLKMDVDFALQLFCRHAFSRDSPLDGYYQLSSDIVLSTGGLPLAIEVIGSLLNGKDQEIWKETLNKLREVPEKEILEKLRISYDDLENHHKQIFLDIACFFYNENKTDAIYMWTACKFYPNRGIEVLTNRCLVRILDNDQFQMHDQLIALGRQIVREDSPNDLEKQSRLWIAEEALQIMRTTEVKHKVQALELFKYGLPIEIRNEDFERLPNLRILNLERGTFAGNFTSYSNLRWFSWHYPPFAKYRKMSNFNLDFRADNLYLDQLVVFKLNGIDFKDDSKAWDLIKRAQKLKVLSISSCSGITTIPDISRCSSLERLTLDHCDKLKRIESFIRDLQSLIELKIKGCYNITNLPEEVGALVKLKCLSLSSCIYLSELPSSLGNLTSLMELDLSGPKIRELPNFIGQLKSLRILRFPLSSVQDREHHDWQLPSGISTLVNLEELDLSRHNGMKGEIPVGEQTFLRILNLRKTGIGRIPRTINKLHHLQTLDLTDCNEIQELPELPTSLKYLFFRSISLHSIPNLSNLTNLVKLVLSDGDPYYRTPKLFPGCDIRWIGNLSKLKWLELDLLNVPVPPELASLSLLKEVLLTRMDLKPLALLSSSCWSLRNLSTLHIVSCVAEDISLDRLPQLESIICKCKRLKRLSILSELKKLRDVRVYYCPELVELRVVGLSKSLKDLSVLHCKSLTRISGLQYLKNLEKLGIQDCKVADIEGLDELESLETLCVAECRSLRRLIDASCTKIPDICNLYIRECGYSIKDSERGMPLKRYREEVLLDTSKKISITIRFHLGVKKSSERFQFVGGIEREKEGVDPYLLTYEGLVADLKNFGFGLKRMWCRNRVPFTEIKSDKEVNRIFKHSFINGFLIHLMVEGWVHSEWEGEYDDEMMEMLREQRRMKTDVYSDEDEVKWWGVSHSDSDSDSDLDLDFDSTSFADLVPSPISFTIRFHLGGKKSSEPSEWYGCIGGIERDKEVVDPSSVTYEGLIVDVKIFGFRMENMWHQIAWGSLDGIGSDVGVKAMLRYASRKRSLIHLLVEGGVDSEWEGEYDDEMMKMLREQRRMKTDVCFDEDGAKGGASCPNEDSNSASVGGESETHGSSSIDDFELERGNTECFEATTSIAEKNLDTVKNQVELHEESRDEKTITSKGCGEEISLNTLKKTQDGAEFDISGSNEVPDSASVGESETDCNSSIDDFRLEPGNTECFEAKGNRRQMRDGRIRRCDSIDGGKTASIKNRKKDKDEIGEPANPSDFVGSSGQTRKGVEHYEKYCKVTTEVGDQRDFSLVKRDKNVEIDRVPTKTGRGSGTGCVSNPGRYPTERGRGRGRASSSRNGEGLSLGRDAASTLGRGTASNSGRDIASSSQSSTTSSLRRDRGSTSGKGTTLTSGRGMTLSLGMGRGSSSRTDTTKMGTTSNPRRAITSSSQSSASLSIGRGRGSTLGGGATVSSGRAMTLSLGMGRNSSSRTDTTKMGTASIPGRGITSSSPAARL